MGKTTNRVSKNKRAHIQQSVITVASLCIIVGILVWMVLLVSQKDDGILKTDVDVATSTVDSNQSDGKTDSQIDESTGSQVDDSTTESDVDKEDDFSDACFIGDSRTVGLSMNANKPKATFYCSTGLNVNTAVDDKTIKLDDGTMGSVIDAIKQRQFSRIYIMFGLNELGWPYPDVFEQEYEELIGEILAQQPDAKIYVQSILPVTAAKSGSDATFTNENVNKFNDYIKQAAEAKDVIYLNVRECMTDENGALPDEASTDGIHLVKDYLVKWLEYLEENT